MDKIRLVNAGAVRLFLSGSDGKPVQLFLPPNSLVNSSIPVNETNSSVVTPVPMTTNSSVVTSVPMTTNSSVVTSVPMTTNSSVVTSVPMTTNSSVMTPVPMTTNSSVVTSVPMTTNSSVVTPVPMTTNSSVVTPVPMTTNSSSSTTSSLQQSIGDKESVGLSSNHSFDNTVSKTRIDQSSSTIAKSNRDFNKETAAKTSRKSDETTGETKSKRSKNWIDEEAKSKRSKNWTDEETKLFIEVWHEYYDRLMTGGSRNTPIYNAMAQQIKEMSPFARLMTAQEVKMKIFNLVSEYRKKKKDQGKSGGSPCNWRFFDRIDQIIGSRPYNDDSLLSDSITLTDQNQPQSAESFCSFDTNEESFMDENSPCEVLTKEKEESSADKSSPSASTMTTKYLSSNTTSKTPDQPNRKVHLSRKKRVSDAKMELLEKMLIKIDEANEAVNKAESKSYSLLERQTNLQEESVKNEKEFLQVFRSIANKMNSNE